MLNSLATLVGHLVLAPITITIFLIKTGFDKMEEMGAACLHGNPCDGRCVCGELEFKCSKHCSYCKCM